jgi:hypothetical protein
MPRSKKRRRAFERLVGYIQVPRCDRLATALP